MRSWMSLWLGLWGCEASSTETAIAPTDDVMLVGDYDAQAFDSAMADAATTDTTSAVDAGGGGLADAPGADLPPGAGDAFGAPDVPEQPMFPVVIECGGNDQFTSLLCTPDGYCDFDVNGAPVVRCCEGACDGESGGLGHGPPPTTVAASWLVNPTVALGEPCHELSLSIRTWTYGLSKPRSQWVEGRVVDRDGKVCPVAEIGAWIECYPWPLESQVVASGPGRVLVACEKPAQEDGKTRPVWVRWRDEAICGAGLAKDSTANPDAVGWCQLGYAWWTPEAAPWFHR